LEHSTYSYLPSEVLETFQKQLFVGCFFGALHRQLLQSDVLENSTNRKLLDACYVLAFHKQLTSLLLEHSTNSCLPSVVLEHSTNSYLPSVVLEHSTNSCLPSVSVGAFHKQLRTQCCVGAFNKQLLFVAHAALIVTTFLVSFRRNILNPSLFTAELIDSSTGWASILPIES
jgi:hypothetical protein